MPRHSPRLTLLMSALLYVALLLRWGYVAGRHDQIELLPYVLKLHDGALFRKDLFLQPLSEIVPNERLATALLLYPFGAWGDRGVLLGAWLWHVACGLALGWGLWRIATLYIRHPVLAWLPAWGSLIALYGVCPGGNELYYNTFQASNVAKALLAWGLWRVLRQAQVAEGGGGGGAMAVRDGGGRPWGAAGCVTLATVLHPLAGLQVGLLVLGGYVLMRRWSAAGAFGGVFSVGVAYVGWLWWANAGYMPGGNQAGLFELLYQWRVPHHYIPSAFGWGGYAVLGACGAAIAAWEPVGGGGVRPWLAWLALWACGAVVYTWGVEVWGDATVASVQWFKSAMWFKFGGLVMAVAWAEGRVPGRWGRWGLGGRVVGAWAWAGLCGGVVALGWAAGGAWRVPLDFGGQYEYDGMVRLCVAAEPLVGVDAVVAHPFGATEVPFYMRRASFVSWKATLRHPATLPERQARLRLLYGIGPELRGGAIADSAAAHYGRLGAGEFGALARAGATHIILASGQGAGGLVPVVAEGGYVLYGLPGPPARYGWRGGALGGP